MVLLAATLSACGRGAPTTQQRQAPAQTSAPSSATAEKPAVAAPGQSATEQANSAPQETAGAADDAETTRGDTSLETLTALSAEQQLPAGRWKPGVSYTPLVPAQPTGAAPGKVEVTEMFWLGCPHCYALEPRVLAWLKSKPDYIQFVRVHVMWGPVHRAHARLYYTLLAVNRADLLEKAFDTIHKENNPLIANSDAESLKLQLAFVTANGVSADAYTKAFNSFAVNANLSRAEDLTQRYEAKTVPLFVINGKYTTDVGMAGSEDNLFKLVDDLAAAERKH
jgi:thiol:disulfide interchange protein DsbA